MATVRNPTQWALYCHALEGSINAGETIEITDKQAAEIADSPIFIVNVNPTVKAVRRHKPNHETRGA